MCVNNLPRVAIDSGEARIRARDLLIATRPPSHTNCRWFQVIADLLRLPWNLAIKMSIVV